MRLKVWPHEGAPGAPLLTGLMVLLFLRDLAQQPYRYHHHPGFYFDRVIVVEPVWANDQYHDPERTGIGNWYPGRSGNGNH